jgi:hypothetical protein
LNERNFGILEEEKYLGISKRAKFWKLWTSEISES